MGTTLDMKKEVTVGNMIAIIIGIIAPLFVWGMTIEKTITEHNQRIMQNEKAVTIIQENYKSLDEEIEKGFINVIKAFHSLDLKLKDKKDRE